jgi:hypothetical protein
VERVVVQEEPVEDLVTVLLINVPALILTLLVLHAQTQSFLTVLVVQNFQFG